jgi:replicative DNA helicase
VGYFESALEKINRGMQGLNEGLPMGFNRLVQFVPNIQQSTYYLIGASTGVGKTAFVDDAFMYNPFDYIISTQNKNELELDIDYFSYEIDRDTKIVKGMARRLYYQWGILTDINYVLSRGKNRVSQDIYDRVVATKDYFNQLEDKLTVFDIPENPTGMNKYLYNKALQHGKVHHKTIKTLDDSGKEVERQVFDRYTANNPKRYHIVIVDHISLMKEERGYTLKENIDKMSQYLIQLRNNFGIIPVVIQQLSFDGFSSERARLQRFAPMLSDFGDSRYTTRDANFVLSLFNPMPIDLKTFSGYNIEKLQDNFRSLEILKGRDGGIGTRIGLEFVGAVGTFKELPKATEMTDMHYAHIAASRTRVHS